MFYFLITFNICQYYQLVSFRNVLMFSQVCRIHWIIQIFCIIFEIFRFRIIFISLICSFVFIRCLFSVENSDGCERLFLRSLVCKRGSYLNPLDRNLSCLDRDLSISDRDLSLQPCAWRNNLSHLSGFPSENKYLVKTKEPFPIFSGELGCERLTLQALVCDERFLSKSLR